MTVDRRISPNPALALREDRAQITVPVANLLDEPGGTRDRQLLFGETVAVLGSWGGFAYIRAEKDGYHGFVAPDHVGARHDATHRVSAPACHVYAAASFKARDLMTLSFGSLVSALGDADGYVETGQGFIPAQHLVPVDHLDSDPVQVAETFLGTPYLWGGNSRLGIDCSGLVQVALLSCGISCPGDSDQQMAAFPELASETQPQRGDLMFWKGHVALVADAETLLHANAHHMMTTYENMSEAIDRIEASGEGPVLKHVRPERS